MYSGQTKLDLFHSSTTKGKVCTLMPLLAIESLGKPMPGNDRIPQGKTKPSTEKVNTLACVSATKLCGNFVTRTRKYLLYFSDGECLARGCDAAPLTSMGEFDRWCCLSNSACQIQIDADINQSIAATACVPPPLASMFSCRCTVGGW